MKAVTSDVSLPKAAMIAGISLIVMTIIAPIANFSILNGLVVPDDAVKTYSNIVSTEGSFRIAIILFYIVAILDIIVAWALYIFLEPVNKGISLLAAWFRIIYAAILAAALFNLLHVLQLLGGASYVALSGESQLAAQVMISVTGFTNTWEFGLILFGCHLALLGYLLFKAGYMKRILGVLVVVAAAGYLVDGFGTLLSAKYTIHISAFTFIGEVVLIFWLLISGRKVNEPGI